MSILYNFVLNIIAISFLVSRTDATGVWCVYSENDKLLPHHQTLINNVPDSCEYVLYGSQYVDALESRFDANIQQLLKMGKKVYFQVMLTWGTDIFNFLYNEKSQNKIEFFEYLKDKNISGILLSMFDIYDTSIEYTADQIQHFLKSLKTKYSSLKVGFMLSGKKIVSNQATTTTNEFFNLLNEYLDFYFIESISTGAICNNDSSKNGRFPTSDNDSPIKMLATAVKESKMENSKTVIGLNISVTYKDDSSFGLTTYGNYCKSKGWEDKSKIWCADSTQQLYDLANHLKPSFGGFALISLDNDDFEDNCGCGTFPVSNAYIQGWNSEKISTCSAISGPAVLK